jgi:hypothetical protein
MADPDMMAVDEDASSRTSPYEGVLSNGELTEAIFAFSSLSENRQLADEGLYASKYLASLVNVYIPYMP